MDWQLLVQSNPVTIGSAVHIVPILAGIVVAIILIWVSNKKLKEHHKFFLFNTLGCLVALTVISFHFWKAWTGDYKIQTDLPLYLCSFLALIIPIFTFSRRYWMFEILVFIVIAGTTQAVITPDIPAGFPSFDYVRYWVAHLGLLLIIAYAIFVFKMRPRVQSIFKSIIGLNIYMVLIFILNQFLDANYSYLSHKPKTATALDFFHDWPYYIFEIELILLPYFFLIYEK